MRVTQTQLLKMFAILSASIHLKDNLGGWTQEARTNLLTEIYNQQAKVVVDVDDKVNIDISKFNP